MRHTVAVGIGVGVGITVMHARRLVVVLSFTYVISRDSRLIAVLQTRVISSYSITLRACVELISTGSLVTCSST